MLLLVTLGLLLMLIGSSDKLVYVGTDNRILNSDNPDCLTFNFLESTLFDYKVPVPVM